MAFIGTVQVIEGPEARGVLTTQGAVAVEEVTQINEKVVVRVDPLTVRFNKSEQVAFIATTQGSPQSLYIATDDGNNGYTFRRVASVQDVIETGEGLFEAIVSGKVVSARGVLSIDDLRLDDSSLVSFRSGDAPDTTTLFRELQRDVFSNSYVDHDESRRFLVFGAKDKNDPPGVLSVNTNDHTVTTLLSVGDSVEGLRIDRLAPPPVDGYADGDENELLQCVYSISIVRDTSLALTFCGSAANYRNRATY